MKYVTPTLALSLLLVAMPAMAQPTSPDDIRKAGALLDRRAALVQMLESKHQVYDSSNTSNLITITGACNVIAYDASGKLSACEKKPDYPVPCDDTDTAKSCVAMKPKPPEPPKPPARYEVDPISIGHRPFCSGFGTVITTQPATFDNGCRNDLLNLSSADTVEILNLLIAKIDAQLAAMGVKP